MIETRHFDADAATPAEWADYHAHRRLRAEEDDPGDPITSDRDFEHDLRRHRPLHETHRLVARVDGRIVGSVGFWFRREGSPDAESYRPFMYVWGGVQIPWRRQGVATALLRGMLEFMQARGKTTATIGAHVPDGHAFLTAIGAVEKQRSVVNRLAFDRLDWDELAGWQAAAAAPGSGLRWEVHAGRVPPERLAALQPQLTPLLRDIPLGALDVPPMRFELQGYLTWYEEMDRRGGEHLLVILLHGDRVAGFSEASWDARFPERVYQEYTAVARDWRGRGLAKGLKAAILRLVHERHPQVRLMSTGNAEENAPILSINDRLGFAVHRRDSTYQITRDGVRAWLATRQPQAPDLQHGAERA